MMRTVRFGLPRRLRLRKRKDYMRLQRLGRRGSSTSCTVILRTVQPGNERIGLTVSKKVGNAVVRNRIKRRLRHILRLRPENYRAHEINVIAHPQATDASFSALEKDVWSAFEHAKKKWGRRGHRSPGPKDKPRDK